MPLCHACKSREIPPRNRIYCQECSRLASTLWKRRQRREWTRQYHDGLTTEKPWLDGWRDLDAYHAYHREYQRRRRAAERDGASRCQPARRTREQRRVRHPIDPRPDVMQETRLARPAGAAMHPPVAPPDPQCKCDSGGRER